MAELHLLLVILPVSAGCSVTLEGSCSVTHDESDGYDTKGEINLKELTVKANMSTQALDALLAPLVVSKVVIQNCTILNEREENNTFTTPHEVNIRAITFD